MDSYCWADLREVVLTDFETHCGVDYDSIVIRPDDLKPFAAFQAHGRATFAVEAGATYATVSVHRIPSRPHELPVDADTACRRA
jgi:hypothetical protein